jgi:hypothetical protein
LYNKDSEETAGILGPNFISEKTKIIFDLTQSKEGSM